MSGCYGRKKNLDKNVIEEYVYDLSFNKFGQTHQGRGLNRKRILIMQQKFDKPVRRPKQNIRKSY